MSLASLILAAAVATAPAPPGVDAPHCEKSMIDMALHLLGWGEEMTVIETYDTGSVYSLFVNSRTGSATVVEQKAAGAPPCVIFQRPGELP